MPTFEIQGPDGKTYEVDAPDQSAAVSAFHGFAPPDPRNTVLGKIDSAVRGAADTLSLGFADEIASGLNTGFGYLGDYDKELARQRGIDEADSENRGGYRLTGQIAGALTGGAGLVKNGLSLTGRAIDAGYRLPGVALASSAEGSALGAGQGLGSGEGVKDRIAKAITGGEIGGVLGGAVPFAVAGGSAAVRKAITPFASTPERQAAVATLEGEGVPLTAGQKTGSNWLRYRESELGGGKTADLMDRQGEAFTDAAMRRAGGSGRATSDNMANLSSRIGQGFDDISARNTLTGDRQLVADMQATAQEYGGVLPSEQRNIFYNLGNDIADRFKANNGTISGKDYQTIRSRLSRMAQSYRKSDPEFSNALRGLRNALDSNMERSINPADKGAWAELRRQYGNKKVLENAISGAGGEDAAMGLISPARLRMAASSGRRGQFAQGQGDFDELAKAGQAGMTPLPNSGTPQRLAAHGLTAGAGAGIGALIGGLPGMALGLTAPYAAGRALMSRQVQNYLANQTVTGTLSPQARAIANAILLGEGSAIAGRLPSP